MMPPRFHSPHGKRRAGSVLILALWALLLLSAAIFAWVKFIQGNLSITYDRANGLEAKALAHSGVMVALNPQVSLQTALLNQQIAPDRGYKVQMIGEGGKLNLNWLFTPPATPDPQKLAIFQRYISQRGLNLQQQLTLIDCILDWLEPGSLPRLNGAKDEGDYHPPMRGQFLTVDELAQVKGSAPLVSQAGWKDDFTIYTNPGLVDLQSASLRILEVLPGVGDANAQRFVNFRQGPDHLDGTVDDHIFKDVSEAISYLGLNTAQAQILAPLVYIENPLTTVHILSTGQCGNVYRKVEVVAKKAGLQPIILSWKEL
jgi:hypothetical protein